MDKWDGLHEYGNNIHGNKTVEVIWTLTQKGNTGYGKMPDLVRAAANQDPSASCLQMQKAKIKKLLQFVYDNGFVMHETSLAQAIGVNLICFALPFYNLKGKTEHQGKNNILATFLTTKEDNGLAANTILGKAVFIRLNSTGQPVDFVRSEALRLMFFIFDFMYYCDGEADMARGLRAAKFCYPFYNGIHDKDHKFADEPLYGFGGENYFIDGDKQEIRPSSYNPTVVPEFIVPENIDI